MMQQRVLATGGELITTSVTATGTIRLDINNSNII
jgi:hypothetical protein